MIILTLAIGAAYTYSSGTGAGAGGPQACPPSTPSPATAAAASSLCQDAPSDPEFASICYPGLEGHAWPWAVHLSLVIYTRVLLYSVSVYSMENITRGVYNVMTVPNRGGARPQ